MKIARLPDGQMIEFPDDVPDEVMDQHVRNKLGVPEPLNGDQALRGLLEAVSTQGAQLQQQVMQLQSELAQATQVIASMVRDVAQALDNSVQNQQSVAQQIAGGFDGLQRAFLADTELVTDKNGKPVKIRKVI